MTDFDKQENNLRELIPAHGHVSFDLTRKDIQTKDPEEAARILRRIAQGAQVAAAATVYYRWLLGLQLIHLRDNGIWKKMINPEIGTEATGWDNWLREHYRHFDPIGGRDTAWNAIALGKSKALAAADDETLRSFPRMTNAYTLARAERDGKKITPEVMRNAIEMPVETFREAMLGPKPGPVRGVVTATTQTDKHAVALTEILGLIKNADHRALIKLRVVIEQAFPLCGDNPTDVVDLVTAAAEQEVQSMRKAVSQLPVEVTFEAVRGDDPDDFDIHP